ncbi:DUF4191 domain-containing protein [Smaragdicoccus niigatensis]|uniref:DUF4191 domain-containing protein n=1 Tax=Smaragdicoccus niigatensis TaxID=359359 RepID=UPI000363AF17|nr:DUF4191 domain-containing protein [Smaragdicoccus niigatensis]
MAKGAGDQSKEAKAAAKAARKAASKERRKQIFQAFNIQRKEDKLLIPLMSAAFLGAIAIVVIPGLIFDIGSPWFLVPIGVLLGVLLAFIIFGRRVQKSVYGKAEGQPGAAAWVLENMKGPWQVRNAVAATTQMDAVHRVIGRAGIILVGEGAPHRVKPLLAQEKKRTGRLVGDVPVYEVLVGNDAGQVPLKDLQKHLLKLPRNIDQKTMDSLDSKLQALGARSGPAMPKGPLPPGAKMRGGMQRTVKRRTS